MTVLSEPALLRLVERHPHPAALARRLRDGSVVVALRRLEAEGLVRRRREIYVLTSRGRRELALTRALLRLLVRSR